MNFLLLFVPCEILHLKEQHLYCKCEHLDAASSAAHGSSLQWTWAIAETLPEAFGLCPCTGGNAAPQGLPQPSVCSLPASCPPGTFTTAVSLPQQASTQPRTSGTSFTAGSIGKGHFASFIPAAPRFSISVLPSSQETYPNDHDTILAFSLLLIRLIIWLFWTNLATTWAPCVLAHGLHPIWLVQLKVRAQLKPWPFSVHTVPLFSKRGVAVSTTFQLPYLQDEFPTYTSPSWCHH